MCGGNRSLEQLTNCLFFTHDLSLKAVASLLAAPGCSQAVEPLSISGVAGLRVAVGDASGSCPAVSSIASATHISSSAGGQPQVRRRERAEDARDLMQACCQIAPACMRLSDLNRMDAWHILTWPP